MTRFPAWCLAAYVTFVLPKAQPTWPGMIVRCDQPELSNIIYLQPHAPTCPDGKCQCHWECENGVMTEQFIENGNQSARPVRCNDVKQPCPTGYGMFNYVTPVRLEGL